MTKTVLRHVESEVLTIVDNISEWMDEILSGEFEYVREISEDETFQCVEPSGSTYFFSFIC